LSDTDRVIYVAATVGQAHALKNLLESNGIKAYVTNDTLSSGYFAGEFFDTAPRVLVHEEDADDARRIALAAEYAVHEGSTSEELDELEREPDQGTQWPACPSCRRPRLTSCPVCETAGTQFDEAFLPESSQDNAAAENDRGALLVICPTCDEPFSPQFPPRCEWCGHRFSDSPEPRPEDLPASTTPAAFEINTRVLLVVAVLVASMAALLGWFYFVLHSTQ
jgi:Putative prokaryotic signal transducing protein